MTALVRHRTGTRVPSVGDVVRDLAVRAVPPACALLVLGLVVGYVVVAPLSAWTGEDRLSSLLQAGRTPFLDGLALTVSTIGGVTGNAVICVLSMLVVWVISRQWWLVTLPLVALNLHIVVHIVTSTLVSRDRPAVDRLDVGQPTASFPSGHMGATTAQLLVMALFLWCVLRSLAARLVVVATFAVYLLVLGWSRVYLGMHHPTDVVWGAVNGVACGLIAWWYLRSGSPRRQGPAETTGRAVTSVPDARG